MKTAKCNCFSYLTIKLLSKSRKSLTLCKRDGFLFPRGKPCFREGDRSMVHLDKFIFDPEEKFLRENGTVIFPRKKKRLSNFQMNKKLFASEIEKLELFYEMIAREIYVPLPPTMKEVCEKFGISKQHYRMIVESKRFKVQVNRLRKELRSNWAATIDQSMIKRAIEGSVRHQELFYKIEGELETKLSVTNYNPQELPTDPQKIQDEINKLTNEVSELPLAPKMKGVKKN